MHLLHHPQQTSSVRREKPAAIKAQPALQHPTLHVGRLTLLILQHFWVGEKKKSIPVYSQSSFPHRTPLSRTSSRLTLAGMRAEIQPGFNWRKGRSHNNGNEITENKRAGRTEPTLRPLGCRASPLGDLSFPLLKGTRQDWAKLFLFMQRRVCWVA